MLDIEPYRDDLEKLCRRYGVRELSLFGSALRDDFDAARSDLDFVVDFMPLEPAAHAEAYFGFAEGLETLFGRPVDLISLRAVRNPYLRSSIEAHKETLYAA